MCLDEFTQHELAGKEQIPLKQRDVILAASSNMSKGLLVREAVELAGVVRKK
jgi:hypothetical protein